MPPVAVAVPAAPVRPRALGWRGALRAGVLGWGRHVVAHAPTHARVAAAFGVAGAALALLQHGAVS